MWHAHEARFDIPLAFWIDLAFFGLYEAITRRESLKRRFPILLGGGGLLLPLLGAYSSRLGGDFNANFFVNENLVLIGRAMGRAPEVRYSPGRSEDVNANLLDASRFRERMGWEPRVTPPRGIERMLQAWRATEANPNATGGPPCG